LPARYPAKLHGVTHQRQVTSVPYLPQISIIYTPRHITPFCCDEDWIETRKKRCCL